MTTKPDKQVLEKLREEFDTTWSKLLKFCPIVKGRGDRLYVITDEMMNDIRDDVFSFFEDQLISQVEKEGEV